MGPSYGIVSSDVLDALILSLVHCHMGLMHLSNDFVSNRFTAASIMGNA